MKEEIHEIPGYRFHEFVGDGGFGWLGSYWEIKKGEKSHLIVIKALNKDIINSKSADLARKYQRKEYDALYDLKKCSYVPTVEGDIIEYKNNVYIKMEYVRGHTLEQIVDHHRKNNKYIEPKVAGYIADELIRALKATHKLKLIHRDLTPKNIMVVREADPLQLKLIDFGLAMEEREWKKFSELGGRIEGNPYYMSPEQFKGEAISRLSDFHQYGQVFYYLLTNTRPFYNEDVIQRKLTIRKLKEGDWNFILKRFSKKENKERVELSKTDKGIAKLMENNVIEGFYIPPRRINQDTPKQYGNIIRKCLEVDPKNRYQNEDEVKEDLKRASIHSQIDRDEVRTYLQRISEKFPSKIW